MTRSRLHSVIALGSLLALALIVLALSASAGAIGQSPAAHFVRAGTLPQAQHLLAADVPEVATAATAQPSPMQAPSAGRTTRPARDGAPLAAVSGATLPTTAPHLLASPLRI